MAHEHANQDQSVYYLDQLCTIAFCGALGVVQLLLWKYDMLKGILNYKFHMPVVWGALVLFALAVVRGIALWVSAAGRQTNAHAPGQACNHNNAHEHRHEHGHDHSGGHDHEHSHEHCHEHGHSHEHEHGAGVAEHPHDHTHEHHEQSHDHGQADCGHDHGWAPWRYIVLLVPILLSFWWILNLSAAESGKVGDDRPEERAAAASIVGLAMPGANTSALTAAFATVAVKLEEVDPIKDFKELQEVAYTEETRSFWTGKLVRVKGEFVPSGTDRSFGLRRWKMTCCAADAIPLNVDIRSPTTLALEKLTSKWVNVTGKIKFERRRGRDDYATVLEMRTDKDVKETTPDANMFLQ
jgi:hypothetical protein